MSRTLGVSAAAAAAVAATALTGAAATGVLRSPQAKRGPALVLRGHVVGLYPGARKRLVVVVHNRSRRTLRVRAISVRVRNASRRCRAGNIHVTASKRPLRIRPGGSRRVALTVAMRGTSPNACQGAVFPLAFRSRVDVPRLPRPKNGR